MRRIQSIIALLLVVMLVGCAADEARLIVRADAPAHQSALVTDLPVTTARDALVISYLARGHEVACSQPQAEVAQAHKTGVHWQPHYIATVVIAVDRTLTDAVITDWADLLTTPEVVGVHSLRESPELWEAVGGGSLSAAIDFYATLRSQQRLALNPTGRLGVYVGTDTRFLDDPRYELIVPSSGTTSFVVGIASRSPIRTDLDRQALVDAGYRLSDGTTASRLNYSSARTMLTQPEWADELWSIWHHNIRGNWLSAEDTFEALMLAFGLLALVIGWTTATAVRVTRRKARLAVQITGALMAGWVIVRMLKFSLPDHSSNPLWYAYYFFMLSLPLVLLWLSQSRRKASPERSAAWFLMVVYNAAMVLFVFTNDAHHAVFRSPDSLEYRYNWGYYLVIAGAVVPMIASLVTLLVGSLGRGERSRFLWPTFWMAVMLGYCFAYAAGVPIIGSTDITLMLVLITIAFYESALRSGFIPNSRSHALLFRASPLAIQLIDNADETVLASPNAVELDERERSAVRSGIESPTTNDPNIVLASSPISGGRVVWEKDLREVASLQHRLRATANSIAASNARLAEQEREEQERVALATRTQLLGELQHHLTDEIAVASALARQNREHPAAHTLARLSLQLCVIKRRSDMFFYGLRRPAIGAGDLCRYLDELARIVAHVGVRARCFVLDDSPLDMSRGLELYRSSAEFFAWTLGQPGVVALLHLDGANRVIRVRCSAVEPAYSSSDVVAMECDGDGQLFVLDPGGGSHA